MGGGWLWEIPDSWSARASTSTRPYARPVHRVLAPGRAGGRWKRRKIGPLRLDPARDACDVARPCPVEEPEPAEDEDRRQQRQQPCDPRRDREPRPPRRGPARASP